VVWAWIFVAHRMAAPQLHFEIRKGSTPVDPQPYLDKGGNG